jgi:hypothetical protein
MRYDPKIAPDPHGWLALAEADRLDAILRYHERIRFRAGSLQLHAIVHVTVETQIAEGVPAVVNTMERLMAEGLGRHDALHAVGSVLAAQMFDIVNANRPHDPEAYARKLDLLTAAGWRAGANH